MADHNIEPYSDNIVRTSVTKLNKLFLEASRVSKVSDEGESQFSTLDNQGFLLLLMQNEIMRGKRALLAYHRTRLDHLAKLTKELPTFPANVRPQLSKSENKFQVEYAASLGRMAMAYGNIVNVNGQATPPKDLYITVRVVKDCGIVQTEFGPLYLNANSFHYVRKADVDHLISQGFLTHC